MPQDFDVFISYSSADNTWVQNLRTALTVKGIRVWLDKDQIRPGDLFVDALETGISSARCVALVVSPNSTHSGWVKEEYHRALVLHEQVRLIPILLRDAELPGFLTSRKWIDFRDPDLLIKASMNSAGELRVITLRRTSNPSQNVLALFAPGAGSLRSSRQPLSHY